MVPSDYPRRILLAVTGLTPQVVTETLYALALQTEPAFIPTEVHVITTKEGADRVSLSLLDVKSGQFHAFCEQYGCIGKIDFPSDNVHVINDAAGNHLSDIRTPEDNLRSADFITHHVRALCRDDHAALHVSIAGGRKSMGFFVGYSLSLFGRMQDRLSHVLVSEPFESNRDFFFPPLEDKILYDRTERPVSTRDAKIMLADIPFVRLRGGIPSGLTQIDTTFSEAVGMAQAGLEFVSLTFDIGARTIQCGGQVVKLPPILFAFYWWLAVERVRNVHDNGAVVWRDLSPEAFLDIYRKVQGMYSDRYLDAVRVLKKGFDQSFFETKISKINALLRKELPLESFHYLIQTVGKKPHTGYRLTLTGGHIVLPMRL